jgi:Cu(I)/Ag(I) efflux system membrane fusion protein
MLYVNRELGPMLSGEGEFTVSEKVSEGEKSLSERLRKAASAGVSADDIAQARDAFYDLSEALIDMEETFGNLTPGPVYLAFCPMARDYQGASWLQVTDTIFNPYFGDAMLRCGEIQKTFSAEGGPAR